MKLEPFWQSTKYFGWRARTEEREFQLVSGGYSREGVFVPPRIIGLIVVRATKKGEKLLARSSERRLLASEVGRLSVNVWSSAGSGSPRGTVESSRLILGAAKRWAERFALVGEAYEIRATGWQMHKPWWAGLMDVDEFEPPNRCYEHDDCRNHALIGEACASRGAAR